MLWVLKHTCKLEHLSGSQDQPYSKRPSVDVSKYLLIISQLGYFWDILGETEAVQHERRGLWFFPAVQRDASQPSTLALGSSAGFLPHPWSLQLLILLMRKNYVECTVWTTVFQPEAGCSWTATLKVPESLLVFLWWVGERLHDSAPPDCAGIIYTLLGYFLLLCWLPSLLLPWVIFLFLIFLHLAKCFQINVMQTKCTNSLEYGGHQETRVGVLMSKEGFGFWLSGGSGCPWCHKKYLCSVGRFKPWLPMT